MYVYAECRWSENLEGIKGRGNVLSYDYKIPRMISAWGRKLIKFNKNWKGYDLRRRPHGKYLHDFTMYHWFPSIIRKSMENIEFEKRLLVNILETLLVVDNGYRWFLL